MNDELARMAKRHERLRLLYQVSNVIHSTLDSQEALQLIVSEAVRLMNASSGSVALINPTSDFLEISASQNLPSAATRLKLRVGEGVTGWAARHGKTVRVGDVTSDPRYIAARRGVKSELAVPLEVNGEVRGVINVDSDRTDAFSVDDQELLEQLAVQAAKVIQHTWLYEQLRLKVHLFESLASVSRTINSTLNLDEALRVITREACELMRARTCSLMMLDESREWLDLRASYGAGDTYINKPRLNVEDSLLGVVARRKKPMQIANVQTSSRYQNIEIARREGLISLLSVPLLFAGVSIGTLNVYTSRPYHFSNEEIKILSALAELSAIAIEKARLYERVVDVEEQLRQNEKLSALGLLAAEVAHEIRNPLTVLKLLYHSLDLKFPATDPRSKDTRIIESKLEHLNKIVEQILDFARTTEPKLAPVNLNELIDELGLLVRHKLANQSVRLVRDLQPDLPTVMGDAPQLEQVFLNLILNAAEAMPAGGTLTIKSRAVHMPRSSPAPTHVQMEFRDNGKGMSTELQQRAFTAVLSTTKAKGSGLGLAIVGRIIETHRGEISIKSKIGRGTTIGITLPRK
ncbi:MAG TPA: GAF domain-containing protein [Candidatus Acidoferrales bacterium]|nr:GAF domain-containing protein [Candidatus Acidoferrales bacterium]